MARNDLATIHESILQQHAEIRARLQGIARTVRRDHGCEVEVLVQLQATLLRFSSVFEAHLSYEERELAPRIYGLDARGAEYVAKMDIEHREQRRLLEEICAAVDASERASVELIEDVRELVGSLLVDMDEEERAIGSLLSRGERRSAERMTG